MSVLDIMEVGFVIPPATENSCYLLQKNDWCYSVSDDNLGWYVRLPKNWYIGSFWNIGIGYWPKQEYWILVRNNQYAIPNDDSNLKMYMIRIRKLKQNLRFASHSLFQFESFHLTPRIMRKAHCLPYLWYSIMAFSGQTLRMDNCPFILQ